MASNLSIRKNVDTLSAADLQTIRDGYRQMQAIPDNRGFNYIAGFHGVPGGYCHRDPILFLPWHRAYLYEFEQNLKDRAASATVPWWDWTSALSHTRGIPAAFTDANDAKNAPNPLLKSHIEVSTSVPPVSQDTARSPKSPSALPSQKAIANVLGLTDFNDFSDTLQDIHNSVHMWVGGDMTNVAFAAYDPLFFSHHCMIDRLWYLWQIKNGVNTLPTELLGKVLPPFNLKVSDVLDITRLGYDYAVAQIVN